MCLDDVGGQFGCVWHVVKNTKAMGVVTNMFEKTVLDVMFFGGQLFCLLEMMFWISMYSFEKALINLSHLGRSAMNLRNQPLPLSQWYMMIHWFSQTWPTLAVKLPALGLSCWFSWCRKGQNLSERKHQPLNQGWNISKNIFINNRQIISTYKTNISEPIRMIMKPNMFNMFPHHFHTSDAASRWSCWTTVAFAAPCAAIWWRRWNRSCWRPRQRQQFGWPVAVGGFRRTKKRWK